MCMVLRITMGGLRAVSRVAHISLSLSLYLFSCSPPFVHTALRPSVPSPHPFSLVVSAVTCCRASSGVGATFVVCRVCNPNSSALSVWLLILPHTCSDWSDASPLALPLQCRGGRWEQSREVLQCKGEECQCAARVYTRKMEKHKKRKKWTKTRKKHKHGKHKC